MTIISQESFKRKLNIFKNGEADYSFHKYPFVEFHEENRCQERFEWCQEKIGDNWIWSSPPSSEYVKIYFIHKQDALAFKLTF